MLEAAVLTMAINVDIDLGVLLRRYEKAPKVTCGIKVVGYHITGKPGQTFGYGGETFTIPSEGYVEVISVPRVKEYEFAGKKLPLEDGVSPLDGFSFRWITLPADAPVQEGGHQ